MRRIFSLLAVLAVFLATPALEAQIVPSTTGWYQIPNTTLSGLCPSYSDIQGTGGCSQVIAAWGSALLDTKRGCIILHGGGHSNYFGNEVYSICLTGSSPTLTLLHDASHSPVNVTNNADALSDGTPNSRHDFNSANYLPTTDEYFWYGGGLSNGGSFFDGNWVCTPTANNTCNWTKITASAGPSTGTNGSIPQQAYDPVSDTLYFFEWIPDNMWQYNRGTTSWTNIGSPSTIGGVGACNGTDLSDIIDPVHRLFICAGQGVINTISITSPTSYTNDSSAPGCATVAAAQAPGVTWNPVTQHVVFWVDGSNYYVYDPVGHTCTLNGEGTFTGGPTTGSAQAVGTMNRFAYAQWLGGYVLINSMSGNVWFLRTQGAPAAANADFANRCAAAGVIVCQGFDAALPCPSQPSTLSGAYPSFGGTCSSPLPLFDSTQAASGAGSMHFTIPALSGSDYAGYWRQLFASSLNTPPSGATLFAQNSTFYVQYRQMFDANYLAEQAPASGGGFTFWKQSIMSNDGSTCDQEELTTVNGNMKGFPQMYSQCGADSLIVTLPGSDYLLEQGLGSSASFTTGPGFNCHYQNPTAPTCSEYPTNQWVTYYYKVTIGTWGVANSHIQAWAALPGQSYVEWIDIPNHQLNQNPDTPTHGYDQIELLAYYTGRDPSNPPTPNNGTANTWYDELIVSSQPIAAPATPPAASSSNVTPTGPASAIFALGTHEVLSGTVKISHP